MPSKLSTYMQKKPPKNKKTSTSEYTASWALTNANLFFSSCSWETKPTCIIKYANYTLSIEVQPP